MPISDHVMSVYLPQKVNPKMTIERLEKLAAKEDRSINYLVVKAILEYLERKRD